MPLTEIVFYAGADGTAPVLEWLAEVGKRDRRALAKCYVKIGRLAAFGHEMRRPEADYLRDGIYELRIRFGSVNYRILYFHFGDVACVLTHGLTKQDKVPDGDIEIACERRAEFLRDPKGHTHHD